MDPKPSTYCGACSNHIHCENHNFKAGETLKLFGNGNPDERTTWLDVRKCTGTIDSNLFMLLPALNYLNITESSVDLLPKAFSSTPKLESLDFRNTKTSISKEVFIDCPIKHLMLENLTIPDTYCFSPLKNLDNLTLEKCKIKKINRNTFNNLNSLVYLFIKKCNIESLEDLSGTPNVEYLYLMENGIKEIDLNAILKLEKLKSLTIFGTETSAEINYEEFGKLPNLESIFFATNVYKNLNFSSFPKLKSVSIGTYSNELNDEESQIMDHLKSLNLNYEYHYCGEIHVDMKDVMICA